MIMMMTIDHNYDEKEDEYLNIEKTAHTVAEDIDDNYKNDELELKLQEW